MRFKTDVSRQQKLKQMKKGPKSRWEGLKFTDVVESQTGPVLGTEVGKNLKYRR